MTKKLNCWEFEKCGREPGGAKVTEHGVCPAATETAANGINEGKNGGRICWAIAGTFCKEKVKGKFAKEKFSCMSCDFFKLVDEEENINDYEILTPVQLKEFLANRKKR
ncbi:MAG: two-CW domain-containing protein [Nitrospirota bacterium]